MSRPTMKQLRDENDWLKAKLATAHGFTVPLTDQPGNVFADSLIRCGDRYAIVRHRPMGAQVFIDGHWEPVLNVPEAAFAYDAVEAHRLADELIAEEIAETEKWHIDFDTRPASGSEEHLAEYASKEVAA
jgi:hypothetical protein